MQDHSFEYECDNPDCDCHDAVDPRVQRDVLAGMLKQLMHQLKDSEWTDQHGHKLEMNAVYQRVVSAMEMIL